MQFFSLKDITEKVDSPKFCSVYGRLLQDFIVYLERREIAPDYRDILDELAHLPYFNSIYMEPKMHSISIVKFNVGTGRAWFVAVYYLIKNDLLEDFIEWWAEHESGTTRVRSRDAAVITKDI